MTYGALTTTVVEPEDFTILATGLQFPEGPIAMADGSVVLVEIAAKTLTRIAADGERTVIAELGGGPNGAAIGPDGACYITNNGGCFEFHDLGGLTVPGGVPAGWTGGSIQRVDLATGDSTVLYTECDGVPLRAPNDLVFDTHGGMWFTDHGVRDGRSSDRTGIFYAAPDGSSIVEAAFGLEAPNGIGLSPAGDRVYVAETHHGRVWAWDVPEPGTASGSDMFGPAGGTLLYGAPGMQLFDSLAVDGDGWVCVGTLINGGISAIDPAGTQVEFTALADPLVTNICFRPGGAPTAIVTLSATGQLASFRWRRPVGVLAYP